MKPKSALTFTALLEISRNRLWGAHVRVPASILRKLASSPSRRVVRTLNGSVEHQCALLPYGRGSVVLSVNKAWVGRLGLSAGQRVSVTVRVDKSRYGLPVAEELAELLRQDPDGNRLFHALTPGRRRTLLHIAGLVKHPEARAWRAGVIVRHLKANAGSIQYRQLAEQLKRPGFPSRRIAR